MCLFGYIIHTWFCCCQSYYVGWAGSDVVDGEVWIHVSLVCFMHTHCYCLNISGQKTSLSISRVHTEGGTGISLPPGIWKLWCHNYLNNYNRVYKPITNNHRLSVLQLNMKFLALNMSRMSTKPQRVHQCVHVRTCTGKKSCMKPYPCNMLEDLYNCKAKIEF